MFDISPEEISLLNDIDLRELIARLCEAELTSRGLSPAAVTWGGSQTAADGGLDVRVSLPDGIAIEGFVPRPSTGFQVKKPDMPRVEIITEMRPSGDLRPVIQELADEGGAYVIVSSSGSTSDSALRNRNKALREALEGSDNAFQLHTDFYDRTRLATWVRCHPGLITWVKEKVGRTANGWRPYGPWSGAAESVEAEYLLDDKLRLRFDRQRGDLEKSIINAIDELRDMLAQPGKMVRLVGLSGVGKTRLVQALFDKRIGVRPLPPSLAVYTNLNDNPDPQPTGLASDLIANRTRAILIIDNCPPSLHNQLSNLYGGQNSTVSFLTVEYDVRDDQPEGTQVVTLETSSPQLIERLIQRRFPHISHVDARSIAEASGGNARIAIALAETIEQSESISGLTNDELFQRLFRQRHDTNDALLHAAQACSLVYSFHGELLSGDDAELPHLASLANQSTQEVYRHVRELLRRDLVQLRGPWRAVLPHAIANRLAAYALEDLPYDLIHQHLISSGSSRLAQSFSRRLSYLHEHSQAIAIAKKWLAPNGLLGDICTLDAAGTAMFTNIAAVLPEAALAALERADSLPALGITWHLLLLRSIAYDPNLFKRSTLLLAKTASHDPDNRTRSKVSDVLSSLFTLYLSGTHATIEQRLHVIEQLLKSRDPTAQSLGLEALDRVLRTSYFSSSYQFNFGSHSRDYGYHPKNNAEITHWYSSALAAIERLALVEEVLTAELHNIVANHFRGLWTNAGMANDLESLSRKILAKGFWSSGWAACRQVIRYDKDALPEDIVSRLFALESELKPNGLIDEVRAIVLGKNGAGLEFESIDAKEDYAVAIKRLETTAYQLGASVAADEEIFTYLLNDILRGGNGQILPFGRGLAHGATDRTATWHKLINELTQIEPSKRDIQVLRGFLSEVWKKDKDEAQGFLDTALNQSVLLECFPLLHTAVELDERGIERLKTALKLGKTPIEMYRFLAYGEATSHLTSSVFKDFLLLIVEQTNGFDTALEILYMRLFSDRAAKRNHDSGIIEAGQELLRHVRFRHTNELYETKLADIVRSCLCEPDGYKVAGELASCLKLAIKNNETYSFNNSKLLTALLQVQPVAVLTELLFGSEDVNDGVAVFDYMDVHDTNPADSIPTEVLLDWCAQNSERGYAFAASIISFSSRPKEGGPQIWSEQAKSLLANAPDPSNILALFIERFSPRTWSGSLAAILESNVQLLDSLEPPIARELAPLISEAKSRFYAQIEIERQRETTRDRQRNERFE